jgi:hypothetical protein
LQVDPAGCEKSICCNRSRRKVVLHMWLEQHHQHHLPTTSASLAMPSNAVQCLLISKLGMLRSQTLGATVRLPAITPSISQALGRWRALVSRGAASLVWRVQPCGSSCLSGVDGSVRGQLRRRSSPYHDSADEEAEMNEFVVRYRRSHGDTGSSEG